jgi:hypothetical protein
MKRTHDEELVSVSDDDSVAETVVVVLAEVDGKWNRQGRMYKRKQVTLYGVGCSVWKKNEIVGKGERRKS